MQAAGSYLFPSAVAHPELAFPHSLFQQILSLMPQHVQATSVMSIFSSHDHSSFLTTSKKETFVPYDIRTNDSFPVVIYSMFLHVQTEPSGTSQKFFYSLGVKPNDSYMC